MNMLNIIYTHINTLHNGALIQELCRIRLKKNSFARKTINKSNHLPN